MLPQCWQRKYANVSPRNARTLERTLVWSTGSSDVSRRQATQARADMGAGIVAPPLACRSRFRSRRAPYRRESFLLLLGRLRPPITCGFACGRAFSPSRGPPSSFHELRTQTPLSDVDALGYGERHVARGGRRARRQVLGCARAEKRPPCHIGDLRSELHRTHVQRSIQGRDGKAVVLDTDRSIEELRGLAVRQDPGVRQERLELRAFDEGRQMLECGPKRQGKLAPGAVDRRADCPLRLCEVRRGGERLKCSRRRAAQPGAPESVLEHLSS